jgi:hypothetical protein
VSSHLQSFGGDTYGRDGSPDYVVTCNNGFRAWELTHDDKIEEPSLPEQHTLKSLVMPYEWHPGLNRAECMVNSQIVARRRAKGEPMCAYPNKRCTCGFYAYYDVDKWSSHPSWSAKYQRIEGIIEGFGRCVVGSKGFRAQSAVIVGLLIPDESEVSQQWLGSRDPEQGRELIIDVLRAKFPMVPLYDRLNDLLMNSPLMGKPQLVTDLEGDD